jgi:hypothetical protein
MVYHPEYTTEHHKIAIAHTPEEEQSFVDQGYKLSPADVCQYNGESRAKFISQLLAAKILQEATVSQFVSLLDEYDHSEDKPCDGSGTERYQDKWDTGFSQVGDPYGIQAEYVSQSPNPDAALPTQAEADAIVAEDKPAE